MGKDITLYAVALACSFIAGIITGMIAAKITNGLSSHNNGHDYDDDGGYDDDDYEEDYEDDDEGGEDDHEDEGGEEEDEEYFDDEYLTIGDEEGIIDYFGVRHIIR
jgi:hypothetical protein